MDVYKELQTLEVVENNERQRSEWTRVIEISIFKKLYNEISMTHSTKTIDTSSNIVY